MAVVFRPRLQFESAAAYRAFSLVAPIPDEARRGRVYSATSFTRVATGTERIPHDARVMPLDVDDAALAAAQPPFDAAGSDGAPADTYFDAADNALDITTASGAPPLEVDVAFAREGTLQNVLQLAALRLNVFCFFAARGALPSLWTRLDAVTLIEGERVRFSLRDDLWDVVAPTALAFVPIEMSNRAVPVGVTFVVGAGAWLPP